MIDWDKASNEALDGTFDATFDKFTYVAQGKTSGNPCLDMRFIVTDPEHEGASILARKSLMATGLWSTKEFLVKIGVDPDDLARKMTVPELQAKIEEWNHQFSGTPVRVVCVADRTNPARPRTNVENILGQFDLG